MEYNSVESEYRYVISFGNLNFEVWFYLDCANQNIPVWVSTALEVEHHHRDWDSHKL